MNFRIRIFNFGYIKLYTLSKKQITLYEYKYLY